MKDSFIVAYPKNNPTCQIEGSPMQVQEYTCINWYKLMDAFNNMPEFKRQDLTLNQANRIKSILNEGGI